MKKEHLRTPFSSRLIIVTVIFLVPLALLFYLAIVGKYGFSLFNIQLSGYIGLVVFLAIYIALIRIIAWILAKRGIKWR